MIRAILRLIDMITVVIKMILIIIIRLSLHTISYWLTSVMMRTDEYDCKTTFSLTGCSTGNAFEQVDCTGSASLKINLTALLYQA